MRKPSLNMVLMIICLIWSVVAIAACHVDTAEEYQARQNKSYTDAAKVASDAASKIQKCQSVGLKPAVVIGPGWIDVHCDFAQQGTNP